MVNKDEYIYSQSGDDVLTGRRRLRLSVGQQYDGWSRSDEHAAQCSRSAAAQGRLLQRQLPPHRAHYDCCKSLAARC